MEMNVQRKRVLVMHGIEGSPASWKAKVLEDRFAVYSPDMSRTIRDSKNWRRNRAIVSIVAFLTGSLSTNCVLGWLWWKQKNHYLLLLMGALGILTYSISKYLFRRAVRGLFEKCISIQEKAIREFKPDVVVGSSFGGGICVLLSMRKIWTVHGTSDKVINIDDSVKLALKSPTDKVELKIIDDDHGMDKTYKDDGKLSNLVEELLEKCSS